MFAGRGAEFEIKAKGEFNRWGAVGENEGFERRVFLAVEIEDYSTEQSVAGLGGLFRGPGAAEFEVPGGD